MTTLTRRFRFSASHRLHSDALSAAENDRIYGKCNNPFGHGHDYVLEVTASGPVDPVTGRVLRIETLDRLVQETILSRLSNRNLNLDIPEFATLVPTT
jgi:6-pyruvoyltetrahydropterin/6-carboxytetrahydropterin synthase